MPEVTSYRLEPAVCGQSYPQGTLVEQGGKYFIKVPVSNPPTEVATTMPQLPAATAPKAADVPTTTPANSGTPAGSTATSSPVTIPVQTVLTQNNPIATSNPSLTANPKAVASPTVETNADAKAGAKADAKANNQATSSSTTHVHIPQSEGANSGFSNSGWIHNTQLNGNFNKSDGLFSKQTIQIGEFPKGSHNTKTKTESPPIIPSGSGNSTPTQPSVELPGPGAAPAPKAAAAPAAGGAVDQDRLDTYQAIVLAATEAGLNEKQLKNIGTLIEKTNHPIDKILNSKTIKYVDKDGNALPAEAIEAIKKAASPSEDQ